MEKFLSYPNLSISLLKIFTQEEWNVLIHISSDPLPTRESILSFISFAALFVNVIAIIFQGLTPFSIRLATLTVRAPVFPLPAPASISTGPSVVSTAFFCIGFNLS